MDLLALADFNLVARHGGFGKAARAPAGRRQLCRGVSLSWKAASLCGCLNAVRGT